MAAIPSPVPNSSWRTNSIGAAAAFGAGFLGGTLLLSLLSTTIDQGIGRRPLLLAGYAMLVVLFAAIKILQTAPCFDVRMAVGCTAGSSSSSLTQELLLFGASIVAFGLLDRGLECLGDLLFALWFQQNGSDQVPSWALLVAQWNPFDANVASNMLFSCFFAAAIVRLHTRSISSRVVRHNDVTATANTRRNMATNRMTALLMGLGVGTARALTKGVQSWFLSPLGCSKAGNADLFQILWMDGCVVLLVTVCLLGLVACMPVWSTTTSPERNELREVIVFLPAKPAPAA